MLDYIEVSQEGMASLMKSQSHGNVEVPLGVYLSRDVDLLPRIVEAVWGIAEIDGNDTAGKDADEACHG